MAARALYTVGFWIRETGQALDRAGCRLQGNYVFREERECLMTTGLFSMLVSEVERYGVREGRN